MNTNQRTVGSLKAKRKSKSLATNTGKAFEAAVEQFVKALDPNAEVIRDFKGRDKDTRERQQMDVWVKTRVLGGHIPVGILISCKDYKRVLHAGDIRAFRGELEDSSANLGIIYSSHGFNKTAIAKADANGIRCCRLYRDVPGELPASLAVVSYLTRSTLNFPTVSFPPGQGFEEMMWDDFFAAKCVVNGAKTVVLEAFIRLFHEGEKRTLNEMGLPYQFPQGWETDLQMSFGDALIPIRVRAQGIWRRFVGRRDAHLINGSYCFADGQFVGQQSAPWIDLQGSSPGKGWTETAENSLLGKYTTILVIQHHPRLHEALPLALKGRRLAEYQQILAT